MLPYTLLNSLTPSLYHLSHLISYTLQGMHTPTPLPASVVVVVVVSGGDVTVVIFDSLSVWCAVMYVARVRLWWWLLWW